MKKRKDVDTFLIISYSFNIHITYGSLIGSSFFAGAAGLVSLGAMAESSEELGCLLFGGDDDCFFSPNFGKVSNRKSGVLCFAGETAWVTAICG